MAGSLVGRPSSRADGESGPTRRSLAPSSSATRSRSTSTWSSPRIANGAYPRGGRAELSCRSLATLARRLLGVSGLPLGRGLGPGKSRRPLCTAKPDRVGRLPAIPTVVQPTPDRLRPDGPHLPWIKQAKPYGKAACPFDARDKGAQLRLRVRGRAPASRRNGRLRFILQARLEREGPLELGPEGLGCLPWRNGGARINPAERPKHPSLPCHHSPSYARLIGPG